MAHTEVFLSNDAGTLVPSLPSVSVTNGDTVAFSVTGSGSAFAFFSPGASSALSPAPNGPVALSASAPTVYTFTTSNAGAYSVFFETSAAAPIPEFPVGHSTLLLLQIDTDGASFPGPDDHTKG
jgi:plastocyanin